MIQVYTGNGKGKTTAAIGLAVRAAGHGRRVLFIQLMKEEVTQAGEFAILSGLPSVKILRFGKSLLDDDHDRAAISASLREGLAAARRALEAGEADLLVLDEANVACAEGLIDAEEVLEVLEMAGEDIEVVVTGRRAPSKIAARADLVTEMTARKHPYRAGTEAREGIEY